MGTRDVDGHGYFFTDQESMEKDVREGKFLDYGEFAGELYGIKFSTVRAIIKTGRICVFAISPNVSLLMSYCHIMSTENCYRLCAACVEVMLW